MVELTQEQHAALVRNSPEPLHLSDPVTREEFVLVPADLYDRLQHLLQEDSGPSKREVSLLVERAMKEYDENDPTLELYQKD